jgi:hypothetical protein
MFDLAALPFARHDTPAPLHDAFAVLRDAVGPGASGDVAAGPSGDPDRHAELAWATLHGLATLTRAGRLPPDGAEDRIALTVDLLAPA